MKRSLGDRRSIACPPAPSGQSHWRRRTRSELPKWDSIGVLTLIVSIESLRLRSWFAVAAVYERFTHRFLPDQTNLPESRADAPGSCGPADCDCAFRVRRRGSPRGASAGAFSGGALSWRRAGQYANACVSHSGFLANACVSHSSFLANPYGRRPGSLAQRYVGHSRRWAQGARVLPIVRVGRSCDARRAPGRPQGLGGRLLPWVLLRHLPTAAGPAAD